MGKNEDEVNGGVHGLQMGLIGGAADVVNDGRQWDERDMPNGQGLVVWFGGAD